ncbi:unnamed protein product [Acanthosepion pharaonis]|uniref:Uncharacterized protein n=1 Tax=Acanthosepion pharaonis TaxID=158019 RepID=A0A812CYX4_ACAPH|nr:unnamed protein product [Sepia pharaonis]
MILLFFFVFPQFRFISYDSPLLPDFPQFRISYDSHSSSRLPPIRNFISYDSHSSSPQFRIYVILSSSNSPIMIFLFSSLLPPIPISFRMILSSSPTSPIQISFDSHSSYDFPNSKFRMILLFFPDFPQFRFIIDSLSSSPQITSPNSEFRMILLFSPNSTSPNSEFRMILLSLPDFPNWEFRMILLFFPDFPNSEFRLILLFFSPTSPNSEFRMILTLLSTSPNSEFMILTLLPRLPPIRGFHSDSPLLPRLPPIRNFISYDSLSLPPIQISISYDSPLSSPNLLCLLFFPDFPNFVTFSPLLTRLPQFKFRMILLFTRLPQFRFRMIPLLLFPNSFRMILTLLSLPQFRFRMILLFFPDLPPIRRFRMILTLLTISTSPNSEFRISSDSPLLYVPQFGISYDSLSLFPIRLFSLNFPQLGISYDSHSSSPTSPIQISYILLFSPDFPQFGISYDSNSSSRLQFRFRMILTLLPRLPPNSLFRMILSSSPTFPNWEFLSDSPLLPRLPQFGISLCLSLLLPTSPIRNFV